MTSTIFSYALNTRYILEKEENLLEFGSGTEMTYLLSNKISQNHLPFLPPSFEV